MLNIHKQRKKKKKKNKRKQKIEKKKKFTIRRDLYGFGRIYSDNFKIRN